MNAETWIDTLHEYENLCNVSRENAPNFSFACGMAVGLAMGLMRLYETLSDEGQDMCRQTLLQSSSENGMTFVDRNEGLRNLHSSDLVDADSMIRVLKLYLSALVMQVWENLEPTVGDDADGAGNDDTEVADAEVESLEQVPPPGDLDMESLTFRGGFI